MNATPPEAKPEYSRGSEAPRPGIGAQAASQPGRRTTGGSAIPALVLACGLLAAVLLIVAEFTTLFVVRASTSARPVESVGTGSHHSYALIPIAVLAAGLSYVVWRLGSRPALLALALLGVAALLIALLGDLPDAQSSGLVGSAGTRFASASSSPSTGLYMETLGGVVLLVTSGLGFLLLAPRARTASSPGPGAPRTRSVS